MPLSSPELRARLDELLIGDADFDAFVIDYFPAVYKRFTLGMDRVQKMNILRIHTDPQALSDALLKQERLSRAPFDDGGRRRPPAERAPTPARVKILYLAANPITMTLLDLTREIRAIEQLIGVGKPRDGLEIVACWAARTSDLQRALLEEDPQILHFSGHGSPREQFILEDGTGARVEKEAFSDLIGIVGANVRLVVLNACDTEPVADALVRHIDCAIGMHEAIGDEAAIAFAASFYQALGFGKSIATAFNAATNELKLSRITEDRTPRLVVKAGVDAAERVLVGPTSPSPVLVDDVPTKSRVHHMEPDRDGTESVTEDPALAELRKRFQAGSVVIFAGAGISLAAGLPSWTGLARKLRDHHRVKSASIAAREEIDALIRERKLIDALTAIEGCLGAAEFGAEVEKSVDDSPIKTVPEPAKAIAELAPRLRAVLTTNLDRFLERAFAGFWPTFARATANVVQRQHYILKLHGTREDRSTWVLTRTQYDEAIHADPLLRSAFAALYQSATLLFVGYGLADDDLDLVMGWVRAFAAGQAPQHFALMPTGYLGPARRRQVEDAGVCIVEYATPGGSHDEMVRVLRSLG